MLPLAVTLMFLFLQETFVTSSSAILTCNLSTSGYIDISNESGVITSPNFNLGYYPYQQSCKWRFEQVNENSAVMLSVDYWNITTINGNSSDCEDHLTIGETNICGYSTTPRCFVIFNKNSEMDNCTNIETNDCVIVKSKESEPYISFYSSENRNAEGFNLSYQTINCQTPTVSSNVVRIIEPANQTTTTNVPPSNEANLSMTNLYLIAIFSVVPVLSLTVILLFCILRKNRCSNSNEHKHTATTSSSDVAIYSMAEDIPPLPKKKGYGMVKNILYNPADSIENIAVAVYDSCEISKSDNLPKHGSNMQQRHDENNKTVVNTMIETETQLDSGVSEQATESALVTNIKKESSDHFTDMSVFPSHSNLCKASKHTSNKNGQYAKVQRNSKGEKVKSRHSNKKGSLVRFVMSRGGSKFKPDKN